MRRFTMFAAILAASCAPAKVIAPRSDNLADAHAQLTVLPLADTEWAAGPESAVRVAHVYSDPSKPGLFVQRMQMPPDSKTPPHWHQQDELITVISGSIYMGSGDTFDESKAKEVGPGGLVVIPARSHHFGGSKGGAILQVQGIGPFEMIWLR